MRWGYIIRGGGLRPVPLALDVKTHCHALITGSSGSGKSYALLYLIGSLLKSNPQVKLYLCDFKNSEDFEFLQGYSHYYAGEDCEQGINDYYEAFHKARKEKQRGARYLLIFDEYPAFINYVQGQDRRDKTKRANDMMGAIAEILMLGRGLGFGVWIVTQRADSSLFANGARDNFMVVLGMGRMSKEQKGMVFTGEELPDKIYQRGDGVLLADGHPIYEVRFPRILNLPDWKRHIKEILMQNNS